MKIEYYNTGAEEINVGKLSRSRRRTLYYVDWQYTTLRERRIKFLNVVGYKINQMKDSLNA